MILLDLDETLVKVLVNDNRLATAADFSFMSDNDRFSGIFRDDIHFLIGLRFGVFTAGTRPYALLIANMLKKIGLNVSHVFSREDIEKGKILKVPHGGFLIDENPEIAMSKIRVLPQYRWLRVHPFDFPKGQNNRRPTIIETPHSRSLRDCVVTAAMNSLM